MGYEITSGKVIRAKKIVIYGPEGVGKSTFASNFPYPLFIDTEGGTNSMDVRRLPRPTSWVMLGEELNQVKNDKPCRTLVIDTVDWAENLCIEHICATAGKGGIEDFGWGNGYVYEKEEFAKFLNRLEDIIEVGINVVLTAHAQLRKFSQPDEIGEYDRWELKLGKKTGSIISPLVKEWADLLLFANYKTMAIAIDKEGKKFKAQGNARVMYTEHHPCWDAKNRFGLAPELPFEYSSIVNLFAESPVILKPQNEAAVETTSENILAEISVESQCNATDNTIEALCESLPNNHKDVNEGIPSELLSLMRASDISEREIRHAVSLKGYYPEDTPIEKYDDGFVNGVLLGAWEKIKSFILDNREMHKL